MSQEFERCFKKAKIKKFSQGRTLAPKELKLVAEDLKTARETFKDKNYKWSVIQSYYSMFHSARALLYNQNYRERSHFCLVEAIRFLYVEKDLLSTFLLESLVEAKNLREAADYYGDYSPINSKKLLKKAEKFLKKSKELI